MKRMVINEAQTISKQNRRQKEYNRLCQAFSTEAKEKQILLRAVFEQMASLFVNIQDANASISAKGGVEWQDGKREVSAQLDAYCQMVDTYNDLIKQVRDIIDE